MLWSSYALGARTLLWFGHGCSGHRMPYALGARTLLWFGHGCSGHRMLFEHERYYGLGLDALVIVCSRNTNVIMVWARMLWSSYALGARKFVWFGHECSGHRMLLEHERYHGLGTDALVIVCSRNTNVIMVWARMLLVIVCSSNTNVIMVWVIVCSWSTNVIMVWARSLWSSYALRTRMLLWFGHGCSGHRMLSEHERYYGHGMVWPWTKSKYVYCLNQSTRHRTPK